MFAVSQSFYETSFFDLITTVLVNVLLPVTSFYLEVFVFDIFGLIFYSKKKIVCLKIEKRGVYRDWS